MLKVLLVLFLFFFSLYASDKTTVFILHSYSQEYGWTKKQHTSFISTLNKSDHEFQFYVEYLDTKRIKLTPEYQDDFLSYLKTKYPDTKPDLIYVTDDDALNFVFARHDELFLNGKNIPVVFSGINNLDMANILSKTLYKGVYEVQYIEPNIQLIKQFSPQSRNIYFIGDNSSTYMAMKKELKVEQKKFPKMAFTYISDEHISKVQALLPNKPRRFVLLTTIGGFKDDNNKTLSPKESIRLIKENPNLIILSMEDAYMYDGVVGGYMTSGARQGEEAAKILLQYLQTHSFKNIASVSQSPDIYMFNAQELTKARVILSEYIKRKSIIIDEDKNFIEKHGTILLDTFTVILIIFIFLMIFLYIMQRKKYFIYKQDIEKLESLRTKLYIKDQLISNTFLLGNIGYWRLDTITKQLFISKEILDILEIDPKIYKDDPYLLRYFIHPDDKSIFDQNLLEVQKLHEPLKFIHRMITSHKQLYNVQHLVYTEDIKYNSSSQIIGIIKFEK